MKIHVWASIALALTSMGHLAIADETSGAPEQTRNFYQLVGNWHGKGEMTQTGNKPLPLAMKMKCKKISAGYGISCENTASNKEMKMEESDMMGFNPVDGSSHWYAITNMGEVHDHIVDWKSPNEMHAHINFKQDGADMEENITMKILSKNKMEFISVVSAGGQEVANFRGSLQK